MPWVANTLRELAAEERINAALLVKRQLPDQVILGIKPRGPNDDLHQIDVRREKFQIVFDALPWQPPIHHHGDARGARFATSLAGQGHHHKRILRRILHCRMLNKCKKYLSRNHNAKRHFVKFRAFCIVEYHSILIGV
jgi:hypothetical protein